MTEAAIQSPTRGGGNHPREAEDETSGEPGREEARGDKTGLDEFLSLSRPPRTRLDMIAVRFEDKSVRVTEAQRPSGEGVPVRVRACGICGSDLAMLDAGFPIAGIPGHEIAGELPDGTPVAIEPLAACGSCRPCREGSYQVCAAGPEMIYGVGRDGGMAEEVRVPKRCLVPLPRGLDARTGFLVEPLAVAVHGLRRARIDGASKVLVVGGGAIGLCAVAASTSARAETALIARHAAQVESGRLLGAEIRERESVSGQDYDVVIDCAGTESAAEVACDALRPNGTLLMLASSWDRFVLPAIVSGLKELEVVFSTMYGRSGTMRDVDAAATILGAREEVAEALVTDRFRLVDAPKAFDRARDRRGGAIKVVLEP